jgi:signal transduction histidine kinase
MKLKGGDALQKERSVVERQVTHLIRLVDDLRDVSRLSQGKVTLSKDWVEMASLVFSAVEETSPLMEQHRHQLSLSVPEKGLAVQVDGPRLVQAIGILVTNSARYTEPGGHIEITAYRKQGRIVLTVRDDGRGIDPAMLPLVFEPFAQERRGLPRSPIGSGLGLAIVKSLVALHGGTVRAFSEGAGKGSAFTVELPAAEPVGSANTPE